jgi:YVTN family beta-propeller protein
VAVNPTTNRIYVTNGGQYIPSSSVSVIDGATNTEIDTDGNPANGTTRIIVGSSPHGVALNLTTNRIYTANEGPDTVSVIDEASNVIVAAVSVGANPRSIAVNPITSRIYVGNSTDNTVSVIEDMGGPAPTPTPTPTATPPPAVGGTVNLERDAAAPSASAPDSPAVPYVALGAAAAAFAVLGGGWYARRRRAR